jgi:hypothetical protein
MIATLFTDGYEHNLTYEVVRSRSGVEMWHVDRFARYCMAEERALRRGASPEGARIDALEDALILARNEWVKEQPPSSPASLAALEEMAREIGCG